MTLIIDKFRVYFDYGLLVYIFQSMVPHTHVGEEAGVPVMEHS